MTSMTVAGAIRMHQRLFVGQLIHLVIVAVAALGTVVIAYFAPNFFEYPYFRWGGLGAVWRFWPLFAWGIGVNLIIFLMNGSSPIRASDNRELYGWEIATSILAGVWEELGYRWAFICYAMLAIAILNWTFGAGLGWLLAGGSATVAVLLWLDNERPISLGVAVFGLAMAWVAMHASPVYWLYQLITLIVHYTTFTLMDPVLYGERDSLMVYGAILANAWFRDGHKYQGAFGLVNSWYAGMALLYATVMYGLVTAIVVHALYDLAISAFRFATQKTR